MENCIMYPLLPSVPYLTKVEGKKKMLLPLKADLSRHVFCRFSAHPGGTTS